MLCLFQAFFNLSRHFTAKIGRKVLKGHQQRGGRTQAQAPDHTPLRRSGIVFRHLRALLVLPPRGEQSDNPFHGHIDQEMVPAR
jgi:hypothetical protein